MKKRSLRIIFVSLMLVMQCVLWVSTAEAGDLQQLKVKVINCNDYVTLRSTASVDSEDLAHVPLGEVVWGFKIPAYRQDWYEGAFSEDFAWCCYQGKYGFISSDYLQNADTGNPLSAAAARPESIEGAYLYAYNINDFGLWGGTGSHGYYIRETNGGSSIEITSVWGKDIEVNIADKNADGTYSYVSNGIYDGYESVYECYGGVFVSHGFEEGLAYCYKVDMDLEELKNYLSGESGSSISSTLAGTSETSDYPYADGLNQFSVAQIADFKEMYWIPANVKITGISLGDPYFWDGAGIWARSIVFYSGDQMIAGADIDPETFDSLRAIWVYSPELVDESRLVNE